MNENTVTIKYPIKEEMLNEYADEIIVHKSKSEELTTTYETNPNGFFIKRESEVDTYRETEVLEPFALLSEYQDNKISTELECNDFIKCEHDLHDVKSNPNFCYTSDSLFNRANDEKFLMKGFSREKIVPPYHNSTIFYSKIDCDKIKVENDSDDNQEHSEKLLVQKGDIEEVNDNTGKSQCFSSSMDEFNPVGVTKEDIDIIYNPLESKLTPSECSSGITYNRIGNNFDFVKMGYGLNNDSFLNSNMVEDLHPCNLPFSRGCFDQYFKKTIIEHSGLSTSNNLNYDGCVGHIKNRGQFQIDKSTENQLFPQHDSLLEGRFQKQNNEHLVSECNQQFKQYTNKGPSSNPIQINFKDRLLKCKSCDFTTKRRDNLERHCRSKHNENVTLFTCTICGHQTKRRDHLSKHIRIKHGSNDNLFKCQLCSFSTKCKYKLKEHVTLKHDDTCELHNCPNCKYATKCKSRLKRHIKVQHEGTTMEYNCEFCPYKTKWKSYLVIHNQVKHGVNEEIYKCSNCSFETRWKRTLEKHQFSQHGEDGKVFTCIHCNYKTKIKASIKDHIKSSHQSLTTTFSCCVCKYGDIKKYSITRHIRVMIDDNVDLITCELCPFRTKYEAKFLEHIEKHDRNELFMCANCGYGAVTKTKLAKHIQIYHFKNIVVTH